jgi:hypothetical protein
MKVSWFNVKRPNLKLVSSKWLGLEIAPTGAEYDENAIALRLNLKKAIASVEFWLAIAPQPKSIIPSRIELFQQL